MKLLRLFSFFIFVALTISCAAAEPLAGSGGAEEPAPAAPAETAFVIPTAAAFPTAILPLPTLPAIQPAPAMIYESRRLTLEFPTKIRDGEGDSVRLTLEVDDLGSITPTAEYQGNLIVGEVIEIQDLYDTHNVTAEARFDMAGMEIQPSGVTYEPLKRGKPATFYWSIAPREVGTYRGTVWLHLGLENRLTGEKDRVALSAQIIEIQAVDFFGISFSVARAGGVLGSFISGVVGFPFLEDIVKFLLGRRKKKK